jgi:hypothetical protein
MVHAALRERLLQLPADSDLDYRLTHLLDRPTDRPTDRLRANNHSVTRHSLSNRADIALARHGPNPTQDGRPLLWEQRARQDRFGGRSDRRGERGDA